MDEYRDKAAEIRKAHKALQGISASAYSDDGSVDVTVDTDGVVQELILSPRIYQTADSDALAKQILDTIARARREAHLKSFDVLRDLLPPGAVPETSDLLLDPLLQHWEATGPKE